MPVAFSASIIRFCDPRVVALFCKFMQSRAWPGQARAGQKIDFYFFPREDKQLYMEKSGTLNWMNIVLVCLAEMYS